MERLLAIDLGLRTGLALFEERGRLCWYRSSNFTTRERLRRGAFPLLAGIGGLRWIYAEGDRGLAAVWARAGAHLGVELRLVAAERWRRGLLLERQMRSGLAAKRHAGAAARRVIAWSGAPRPTSLRHDAAEAILIGLWGVLDLGWLERPPPGLGRPR